MGDALVVRTGVEAIDAGQIDKSDLAILAGKPGFAEMMFDGDAGKVGDFLTEPRKAIEEGGFAGVGRSDNRDEMARGGCVDRKNGTVGVAIAHGGGAYG